MRSRVLSQDKAQSKHDLLLCLWELFLIVYAWQSIVDSLQKYTSNIGCLFRMFNAKGNHFFNKPTDNIGNQPIHVHRPSYLLTNAIVLFSVFSSSLSLMFKKISQNYILRACILVLFICFYSSFIFGIRFYFYISVFILFKFLVISFVIFIGFRFVFKYNYGFDVFLFQV